MLDQGQPIYYTGTGDLTYENGRAMAGTWADFINVDLEHETFDLHALDEYMKGLVDGGPTRSGHYTPAVIAVVPTDGTAENVVRANAWMFKQVLARGVHGILLCHAESPGAVKAFVESCRYPFHTTGVGEALDVGRRGSGGHASAAATWGLSVEEYLKRADVWPLNPEGELLLGIKVENMRALINAELSTHVPGIAFAEWGPGDMGMSMGYLDAHDPPYSQEMQEARSKVFAACKSAGLFFLNSVTPENVVDMLLEGVMICAAGPAGEETAKIGRAYSNRTMPV